MSLEAFEAKFLFVLGAGCLVGAAFRVAEWAKKRRR